MEYTKIFRFLSNWFLCLSGSLKTRWNLVVIQLIICSFRAEQPDLDYGTPDFDLLNKLETILNFNPIDPDDIDALNVLIVEYEE